MKKVKFGLTVAGITSLALTGAYIYLMNNNKFRKKAEKKIIDAMNKTEDLIARKL